MPSLDMIGRHGNYFNLKCGLTLLHSDNLLILTIVTPSLVNLLNALCTMHTLIRFNWLPRIVGGFPIPNTYYIFKRIFLLFCLFLINII